MSCEWIRKQDIEHQWQIISNGSGGFKKTCTKCGIVSSSLGNISKNPDEELIRYEPQQMFDIILDRQNKKDAITVGEAVGIVMEAGTTRFPAPNNAAKAEKLCSALTRKAELHSKYAELLLDNVDRIQKEYDNE